MVESIRRECDRLFHRQQIVTGKYNIDYENYIYDISVQIWDMFENETDIIFTELSL